MICHTAEKKAGSTLAQTPIECRPAGVLRRRPARPLPGSLTIDGAVHHHPPHPKHPDWCPRNDYKECASHMAIHVCACAFPRFYGVHRHRSGWGKSNMGHNKTTSTGLEYNAANCAPKYLNENCALLGSRAQKKNGAAVQ